MAKRVYCQVPLISGSRHQFYPILMARQFKRLTSSGTWVHNKHQPITDKCRRIMLDKGKLVLKFQKSTRTRMERSKQHIKFPNIVLREANNPPRTKRRMISWKPIIIWTWPIKIYQSSIWMTGVKLVRMTQLSRFSSLRRIGEHTHRRLGQLFLLLIGSNRVSMSPLNNLTTFSSQCSINM